jgi:uncharacterized protein YdaU (DUF1376 family)
MGDNWYAKYPGDYRRDTAHLTVTQHGAYNLLMDCYYATGKPLPADLPALVRMVGCQTKLERDAVAVVADEFFKVSKDGFRHNPRCDREIEKRDEFIADQSRKGRLSAEAKRQQRFNRGSTAVDFRLQPDGVPEVNPPPPPPPLPPPTTPPTSPSTGGEFPDFWKIYPRKSGRDAACRAWVSMVQNGDAARIFEALSWQLESDQWTKDEGKFVPSAEKYLFDRLWTDEPPAATGPKVTPEEKAAFFPKRKVVE